MEHLLLQNGKMNSLVSSNDIVSVVGLNFYPVSNRVMTNGWDKNTDGWKLMANSLKWAAEGGTATWITGTP